MADGVEFQVKPFRARDTAVEASGRADLPAEVGSFPAENLRTTMQKSRHGNNFKRFATAGVCISLND